MVRDVNYMAATLNCIKTINLEDYDLQDMVPFQLHIYYFSTINYFNEVYIYF